MRPHIIGNVIHKIHYLNKKLNQIDKWVFSNFSEINPIYILLRET
jgi:hypothetical protein